MSKSRKVPVKKRILTLCLLLALPILGKVFLWSIPYVGAVAEQAVSISVGMTLPEGGKTLLENGWQEPVSQPEESDPEPETESKTEPSSSGETSSNSDEPTPTEPEDLGITQQEIDQYTNHDGTIVRKQYTAGSTSQFIHIGNNAYIKNTTSVDNQTVIDAANAGPDFKLSKGTEPQVLIMHTHTTESYELIPRDFFDNSFQTRSRDTTRNMVRVGDEIEKQLKLAGIGVIHDTTEHDYPSYTGAYNRSKVTVQNILNENPSIKVVLDVHRDAIGSDDVRTAPVANINGKDAAQVMIISGCDDGTMDYPNYLKNLGFASLLQKQMEGDYPGLTRPVLFSYRYYNQDLTTGSILLEMGGHANSLGEAVYCGELVGRSLVKALQSIEE